MIVSYMLDTNMVSYIVKGRSRDAIAQLLALTDDAIPCISAITAAEIHYGLAKKPDATALRSLMNSFLRSIKVLAWGENEAAIYGSVKAKLEERGVSLGNMDMMIAAHAVATGAVLVTKDKAFAQVDALHSVVNWATDL